MQFSTDLEGGQQRVVEVSDPKNARPLWQKLLFLLGVIGILSLLVFSITRLVNRSNSETENKAEQKTEEKTATQSAKTTSERCSPKQDLDNTKQGYQACFDSSWKQKELKVSGLEIGLAKETISETFPGTINIAITDKSVDLLIQDLSNNSSKFEFGKANVGSVRGSQIVMTRSRDDKLIAYPRSIVTAVSQNNRTYAFTLNSTEASVATDTLIYEEFLTTVEFLDEVTKAPWSDSRNILVDQPWPNDTITSPVTISGLALSFESVVNVTIKDGDGKTLTETTLKSASGTERSTFSGSVSFDKPKTSKGTIEVFNKSAEDGSDQDKVTIPVKFQ